MLDPSTTISPIAESIADNPHLNRVEIQVALGSIFGDATIAKPYNCKNSTCYFIEGHSGAQVEYLKWKHQHLAPLSRGWKLIAPRRNPVTCRTKSSYFQLRSKSEPVWNQFRTWFYDGRNKVVRRSTLNRLNELGLAVWFMDDGSLTKHQTSRYARLATNGFSEDENEIIRKWFMIRWNLAPVVAKNNAYFELHFSSRQAQALLRIIGRYIHPCMDYKTDMRFAVGQKVELNNARYPQLSWRDSVILAGNDIVCSNPKGLEVDRNDRSPSYEGVT